MLRSLKTQIPQTKKIPVFGSPEKNSVADPDPGSGAFLIPGSGIRKSFFSDPGSRISDPKPIFLRP